MFVKCFSVLHHVNCIDKIGFDNKMIWILSNGALCNISFSCALGKMTLRENSTFESWENRKLHDPQKKNEIKVMENPERPWPAGEKWNPGHGKPGKAMTYRRKMKSRPWETRKGHDLQEKNEIQIIEKMETAWSGDSACSEWICIK